MPKKPTLIVFVFFLVFSCAVGGMAYFLMRPGHQSKPVQIYFPKGTSVSAMGQTLRDRGVVTHGIFFEFFATILGKRGRLKWGEYAFTPGASLYDVLTTLTNGVPVWRRVTIPEGLTSAQIIHLLDHAEGLTGGVDPNAIPEGTLLPETYYYHYGDDKQGMIRRMAAARIEKFSQTWSAGADLPFPTLEDGVILASIVEKETARAAERPRIARVFLNRLARAMPLQSDVTVLYGKNIGRPIGDQDRDLTKDDLHADHPFNTYVRSGLPPAPICHPGVASLRAVLNPAPSQDLYFVADGTGGHIFSENLTQHQKNHQKWRRIRKARQN